MSSAENDTRPVWLTRAQRDWLDAIYSRLPQAYRTTPKGEGTALIDAVAAWDAAPADPAEAVRNAADLYFQEHGDEGDEAGATRAILAALGAPKATP